MGSSDTSETGWYGPRGMEGVPVGHVWGYMCAHVRDMAWRSWGHEQVGLIRSVRAHTTTLLHAWLSTRSQVRD